MEQQAKYAVKHTGSRADAEPISRHASGTTRADSRPAAASLRKLAGAMDNNPRVVAQRKLAEAMDNGPRVAAQRKLAEALDHSPRVAAQPGTIQLAKKKKKQRPPSFKQRQAQSQRDKAAAAIVSPIQNPDNNAWAKSVAATKRVIPVGYQPQKRGVAMAEGMDANTSFYQKNINVMYNTQAPSGKRNKRIGQLASTFTHELAVHGKNPPQPNVKSPGAAREHRAMHHPATRAEYRDVSLATHDSLENAHQKKAFARSWLDDMNFQIGDDKRAGKGEKRARREWAKRQRARMKKRAKVPSGPERRLPQVISPHDS